LYQYFPNKAALLKAALKRHLDEVTEAVEQVCEEQKGNTLEQMATALITAFVEAKVRNLRSSVALYSVSSDVDGAKIAQHMGVRSHKAVVEMLETAREPLTKDAQVVASMLLGAVGGAMRRLLESDAPEKQFGPLRQELIFLVSAYLQACSARPSATNK
jgi:AcrR family transcriptional regulator